MITELLPNEAASPLVLGHVWGEIHGGQFGILEVLQLKEGVLLIQNMITALLEKKKKIFTNASHLLSLPFFFPSCSLILGPHRKSEVNCTTGQNV
ncbi:hypothetical protein CapIbe_007453 [Capra ibex]